MLWEFVTETALRMRDMPTEEGLDSWPKITGGKGLHLMVPIEPASTHDEARAYAKGLAQKLAAREPHRYLIAADPVQRKDLYRLSSQRTRQHSRGHLVTARP